MSSAGDDWRPYGCDVPLGQVLPNFYPVRRIILEPECVRAESKANFMVAGIAIAMFIALFGWGAEYFGWHDPSGKIQLALVTSFILGAVSSYKARG